MSTNIKSYKNLNYVSRNETLSVQTRHAIGNVSESDGKFRAKVPAYTILLLS